ncbi:MAG: hypothetical protein ACUVSX_12435 [Aggregatilineales bacterium]
MSGRDDRSTEILIGIALLFIGLVSMGAQAASAIALSLIIVGLVMMLRYFEAQSRNTTDEAQRRRYNAQARRSGDYQPQPGRERIYRHALTAIERAGLDPDEVSVLATDIGVIAFKGDERTLHRTRPVLDDVDYIQPFVELRLPAKAAGRVRFEIVDCDGQTLLMAEDDHQLERGRNLVTPARRLPIHDAQATHGPWELRISADGVLLAVHRFEWEESASKIVRRYLSEDGEISTALRVALIDSQIERISLDELLADQEMDEAPGQGQQRR